jgi:antitoxin ParD1/3/4
MTDPGDDREVPRGNLPLMEERERKMIALDAAIERGIADIDAGRVHDLDAVCDELDGELADLPDPPTLSGSSFPAR